MITTDLATQLQTYANSFGRGHLKYHKGFSILMTFQQQPAIMDDEVRFLDYLKSCLRMEGFRDADLELVMGWIYERKDEIAA